MSAIDKDTAIYVAGHRGMVGSAIFRELKSRGYEKIITASHAELDLCSQYEVNRFFRQHTPGCVIIAAARVGGINANRLHPAEFLYENIMIQSNLLHACCTYRTKKVIFLAVPASIPRVSQPYERRKYFLTGPLEPTNEGYALAKLPE